MITAYKGKIRISCNREKCVTDKIKADVTPDCFGCVDSRTEILDLEDKVVCRIGELKIEKDGNDGTFVETPGAALVEKSEKGKGKFSRGHIPIA